MANQPSNTTSVSQDTNNPHLITIPKKKIILGLLPVVFLFIVLLMYVLYLSVEISNLELQYRRTYKKLEVAVLVACQKDLEDVEFIKKKEDGVTRTRLECNPKPEEEQKH